MINNRLPMFLGVLGMLMALAAPANAAEAAASDVSGEREFSAKLKVCEACHGENGKPKTAAIPVLLGQREEYVLKQLHDFRNKDRNIEIMTWMAESLSEQELAPAAAYFAKKTWPARSADAPAPAAAPAGMVACQACHQLNYVGGQVVPRLAGQTYEYLVEEMRRFAEGERKNSTDMIQIMQGISPAQREAMARYLSGL